MNHRARRFHHAEPYASHRASSLREAVTVAIATYNGARYVASAIRSAVACGGRVIISDDGSTDDTVRIAKAFGKRVTLFTHETNGGIAQNYDFLLSQCDTPLALFLNQDDLLYPKFLQGFSPSLEAVTVLNGWLIDDQGRRTRLIYRRPPLHALVDGVYAALCHTGFFKSPSQAIFPVKAARDHGGFRIPQAQGQGAEDWMCWLRLAAADIRFRLHMWPRMAYRVHPGNYSNQSHSHVRSKESVRAAMPGAPYRNHRLRLRL